MNSEHKKSVIFILIVLVGLTLRLGYVWYIETTGDYPLGEGRFFIELAQNISNGKGFMLSDNFFQVDSNLPEWKRKVFENFQKYGYMGIVRANTPTSFAEPVVPMILAFNFIIFGKQTIVFRLFQVVVSTSMIFFVYYLANYLESRKVATIASVITAFYPPFIYFTGGIVTQMLFTFFFSLFIIEWTRYDSDPSTGKTIIIGVLSAITLLTRADILLLLPVLFTVMAFKKRRPSQLVWIPIFFIMIVTPWIIRNYNIHGRFLLLPPKAGRNLWESNNYKFSKQFARGEHPAEKKLYESIRRAEIKNLKRKDLVEFPVFTIEDEITRDKILVHRVQEFVKANPGAYLKLCYLRLKEMFRIFPRQIPGWKVKLLALLTDGLILPLAIMGFFVSLQRWRKYWIIHVSLLYHVTVHILTTSGISQRVPIMTLFIIFASIMVCKTWQTLEKNLKRSSVQGNNRLGE